MTFSRAADGLSLVEATAPTSVLFIAFKHDYLRSTQSDHSDGSESESEFEADSEELQAVESSDDESAYGDSNGGSDESGSDFGGGGSDESDEGLCSSLWYGARLGY